MKVIVVKEEGVNPCAYRTSEEKAILGHIMLAMRLFVKVEIWYEDMTEEEFEALKEFEGVP